MTSSQAYLFGEPWAITRPGAWMSRARKARDLGLAVTYARKHGVSNIGYLDVGARWGPSKMWAAAARSGIVDLWLVEPDSAEAADLRRRYPSAVVVDKALSDHAGSQTLFLTAEPGKSSLLRPRVDVQGLDPGYVVVEERDITVTRLDEAIPETAQIDFMKIDVQGAEHLVLAGGTRVISGVEGVQLEVAFAPTYEDQTGVGEITGVLRDAGFIPVGIKPLSLAERGFVEADMFFARPLSDETGARNNQVVWRLLNGISSHARLHHDL